uniref:Ovule protein n=1 Tax=Echinococcus granulosus TaxID=6210 RepID=A0A068WGG0_ECHGR|nr:hypothetical protein EgrG_000911100 [Echinococcus granulosus]
MFSFLFCQKMHTSRICNKTTSNFIITFSPSLLLHLHGLFHPSLSLFFFSLQSRSPNFYWCYCVYLR